MTVNRSPWIHQLDQERVPQKLSQDISIPVAIIGAGIAGVSTAFFLLKNTNKKVAIFEAYKLAHGATGHNAGYIASYFERPLSDIVKEFGIAMAVDAQRAMEDTWALLDEMYTDAGLSIPLTRFKGHAGLSTEIQVMKHLENNRLRKENKLHTEDIVIAEDAPFVHRIPEIYAHLFSVAPREEIITRLETFDPQYVAVTSFQKGVMNSALFCQEVVAYLLEKYKDRFFIYEHTPIAKVVLKDSHVLLDAMDHTVRAEHVVLCTNGFDNLEIFAPSGLSIDTRFHHTVESVVAFMSGFLEKFKDPPMAVSYFQKDEGDISDSPGEAYFYVTRRPYEYDKGAKHNLICIGGPDFSLNDRKKYSREFDFPENAQEQIDDFVHKTYDKPKELEYKFMWHGLMGFTPNRIRLIGFDPEHRRLLYNLGCNGVGILPSIYGGERVARFINGEKLEPSIFDPAARSPESPIQIPLQKDTYLSSTQG